MKPEDYEEIRDLWLNTPGMGLNESDDSKEGITAYLKRNPNTCFVARKGARIVGAILSGHDGRRGFIHHTAVAVSERKQGIGSALVDAALKSLKQEGIKKVALVVFRKNETGDAFWEKQGFSVREDLNYRNKALANLVRIDT
ncbi:GNAT family N-acetyltransferase [Eisenbergiella tayi]|nr:GNAT family N-acetyltransferase [Eisenbergiella tayi]ODR48490.1 GNAT family N-acetyltransferase [Eisenbergiella tayi]